jgi:hypothetical protein
MLVKPWYKQFWPWLLIAIPLATVLKSGHTIYVMNQQSPDLVIDDYYAEGKAINMNLAKFKESALRNLQGHILLAGNKAIVRFEKNAALEQSLTLQFVHNTFAEKDFTVKAERSGENLFVAELPSTLTGKWNLLVTDDSQQWKLRSTMMLPQTTEFKLTY